MKSFNSYIYLITLLCGLSGSLSNAYVLSSYIWQAPDGSYKFVLGDCHIPAEIGTKHNDCLNQLIKICDDNAVPLTVLIEGNEFVSHVNEEKSNTIQWLAQLAQAELESQQYKNITFKITDLRCRNKEKSLVQMQISCGTFLTQDLFILLENSSQYVADEEDMHDMIKQLQQVVDSTGNEYESRKKILEENPDYWKFFARYKESFKNQLMQGPCLTKQELDQEVESLIDYINKENALFQLNIAHRADIYIRKVYKNFVRAWSDYEHDFKGYLCDLYEKNRSCKKIDQLYKTLADFANPIANIGFSFALERCAGKPVMLYCGNNHAQVINRAYAERGFTLIKKWESLDNSGMSPDLLAAHCNEFLEQYNSNELRKKIPEWSLGRAALKILDYFMGT